MNLIQKKYKKLVAFLIVVIFATIISCEGALGNITANSPIERGLSYIAVAIVTHGIIQAICND